MSTTTKTLRKRTSQVNYKESETAPKKKMKPEEVIVSEAEPPANRQPIVAPNGKVFYPCQYCSKIFPQKTTSVTHMTKCPNKSYIMSVDATSVNNNEAKPPDADDLNSSSGSSTENKSPEPKIRISQNITVIAAQPEKQAMADTSVYDYNEQDEVDDKVSDEDALSNLMCKHCKTLFDNPLDLLRHTRDCHNFPRTILPPDEIEKYFDSPNRNFCPICEKPIKTRNFRSVFIKHLLVHTTGLTHECGVCKKKFRRRDHMRAHEKRHIVSV